MSYIFQLFADNQVLLLFFLVGSGAILAKIRIKGVSLGAASVLFLSIGLTAWALHSGYKIEVEHDLGVLGLALFAFAIGISSGPNFFNTIKSSVLPIILMLVSYVLAAGVAAGIGRGFGMDWALIAGTFAGATTNTPALSAASAASGNPALATVGYAISYLFGVIGMLIIASIALSRRSTDKDKPSQLATALSELSAPIIQLSNHCATLLAVPSTFRVSDVAKLARFGCPQAKMCFTKMISSPSLEQMPKSRKQLNWLDTAQAIHLLPIAGISTSAGLLFQIRRLLDERLAVLT